MNAFKGIKMAFPAFTLRQVRYFLAISESRTVSEAADRLHISQGALTEALDELERHMQLRLFVRRRAHGVSLTPAGKELLSHARALMNAADEFQSAAATRGTLLAGRVSIGCYATLAPFIMPALIAAFERHYPALELDLFFGSGEEIAERLADGHCDLALVYDFNLPKHTASDPLYSVEARIVMPASHPLAAQSEIDLADLADEPLIQFGIEPALTNTRRIFEDVGVTPLQGRSASSIELVRSLVGHGFGYSILLHHPATEESYEGRKVVVRRIARFDRRFTVVLARSTYLRPSRRGDQLRNFCLSCFENGPQTAMPEQAVEYGRKAT